MQLTVSFLTTRVTRSTKQDWKKLGRLLGYLFGTINEKKTVGIQSNPVMRTYVDASYATHHDIRGHTGGLITMGIGTIHTKSFKQKLNTKSSTEAELVGASDYIPWTVWISSILKFQGYDVTRSVSYQDNESAIKLEKNGMRSRGDKSRHIHIRYFFIKDILEREEIDLEHCGTEHMVAYFLSKPLQGKHFRMFKLWEMYHSQLRSMLENI